ncbi:MAG TPA: Na+/H+ antiporter NhaA [Cytophagales bacterium]|nr:Na+/H+ antiporter NhaA [Cytophagales bacterium]
MVKSTLSTIIHPFHKLIKEEYGSGIVLFSSVLIALIWANSPWAHSYHSLWETKFTISFNNYVLSQDLHHWINDGLMAIFFFVIGLELKRELMAGELSTFNKAALPCIAAFGGMVVPAFIYFLFNYNQPSSGGWGIPMATDIAFAIGLLTLAGKGIPTAVKVFLTALAVVDDLGAVLVIAFFYSSDISLINLGIGILFLLVLIMGNIAGIRSTLFYVIVGFLGIWLAFLLSGVHATIAGVLVAFTIPARTRIDEKEYLGKIKKLTATFEKEIPRDGSLLTEHQHLIIEDIKRVSSDAETPLQKMEHSLITFVAFVIMPLFALANSGVAIGKDFFSQLLNPISLGIIAGLVIGKFIGVFTFTFLTVKMKLAALSDEVSWNSVRGIALLAGVGFTMSMFIAELAFQDKVMITQAKYGILVASFISGTIGVLFFKLQSKR